MIKRSLDYLFKKDKRLMKDSIILFSAVLFLNIMGYIFHFFVGRTLGPADYGIFGAIMSLIYIITVPMNTLQTSITKFTSNFNVHNEIGKIAYLLKRSIKVLFIVSLITTFVFIILSPFLASFMNTEKISPFLSVSLFLFFALLLPINRGVMQGLQNFKGLGWNYCIEGTVKILIGILFIYLWGLNGAVLAFGVSYIVPFFFSFIALKKDLINTEKFDTKEVYKYSIPVLIMLTSLTLFYSLDVILVKHFFNAVDAGLYAAISLLGGKIVFFGSGSISLVMFPKVAELYAMNGEHRGVLYKSMLLVTIFGLSITLFYWLFPNFSVGLLFGKEYLNIAPMLWIFAALMTLFSLVYLLSFYNVSIHKNKFIYLLILFNIIQVLLIYLFHESLWQIVYIMSGTMLGLFLLLLAYTFKR
mgnify:CR=1 FL=1